MLKVDKNKNGMITIELDGEIDATEMEIGLNQLFELSQDMQNGQVLYRITNFKMPTFSALGVEIMKLPQLFRLLGRIDKAAVLTDEPWIAALSQVEGALIPGLEIKTFDLGDDRGALAFLKS